MIIGNGQELTLHEFWPCHKGPSSMCNYNIKEYFADIDR